ncbi:FapA family protein [Halanaerocella petrolearia]
MIKDKEVIVEAKDINSAIYKGLQLLQVKREQVDVEVLFAGKKGFLGLWSKQARVKLIKNKKSEKDNKTISSKVEKLTTRSQRDLIEIEDNRIRLKDIVDNKYPILGSETGIDLYIEDKLVEESVILAEDKEVKFEVKEEEPISEIKVRVTEDKLKAYLEVVLEPGRKFRPKIVPTSKHAIDFMIVAKEVEKISPEPFTLADIADKLEDLGISYGLLNHNLEQAIEKPNQEFIVAQGDEPVKSIDGWIEYQFGDNDNKILGEDRVDYFTVNQVDSVQRGEVLALKHESTNGQAGINIFGEEIEVDKPDEVEWNLGDGVTVIGNKAVADRGGRPVVKGNKLSVFPVYQIEGNLDMSVGNVNFDGDVIIKKDVCDNFEVKARGKIKVYGNVNQAYLEAVDEVDIKGNVIASEIVAGKLSNYYKQYSQLLSELGDLLKNLEKAVRQLINDDNIDLAEIEEKGYNQAIQVLIISKYNRLPKVISDFYDLNNEIAEEDILEDLIRLRDKIESYFTENCICNIERLSTLSSLNEDITEVINLLQEINLSQPHIKTKYIQNSKLTSSGDILVSGKGSYNSKLIAGGKVEINGQPGFFRGGYIKAEDDIIVKEIGGPGVSGVELSVPADKRIISDKVYINTLFAIGKGHYKFQKDWSDISAYLDEKGKIKLQGGGKP